MEKDHAMLKQKLTVFNILQNVQTIPWTTVHFVIFTLLASIPLFIFLVFCENTIQTTLVETLEILQENSANYLNQEWPVRFHIAREMIKDSSYRLIQLGIFYLVPLHLLELNTAIFTLHLAKKLYTEGTPITLSEMVSKPINRARIKGNFITSAHIIFLSTSFLVGSMWLVTNYYVILRYFSYNMFLAALYRAGCIMLLVKYLHFSVLWNMSMAISVLEEIHGAEALLLSIYFIRGSEGKWVFWMLAFFIWDFVLKLACLYTGCNGKDWLNVANASLLCVGNAIKWVVCMIYFYHCRSLSLKKDDDDVEKRVKICS